MKSLSTGLAAVLAAIFVFFHPQTIGAQPTTRPAENVAFSPHKRGEIDAVTWFAMRSSWKQVRQIIDKGKPIGEPVGIYTVSRFEEDPLSEEQQRDLFERARKADLWRDIWFITVSSNIDGRYSAKVYFKPDVEKGLLRQGKMAACANWIKYESRPGQWPPLRGLLMDYVQVGAEPPECYQPTAQNMPFPMPPGFTLDEVSEIIQSIQTPNLLNPRQDMPRAILGIQRKGDNVEVEMGGREGPLWGRGGTWKCKKTNGVWAVVDTAEWAN